MTMIQEISMGQALAAATIVVKVTGQRRARARIWLGTRLIHLGVVVIGTGIDVDLNAADDQTPPTHESYADAHDQVAAAGCVVLMPHQGGRGGSKVPARTLWDRVGGLIFARPN